MYSLFKIFLKKAYATNAKQYISLLLKLAFSYSSFLSNSKQRREFCLMCTYFCTCFLSFFVFHHLQMDLNSQRERNASICLQILPVMWKHPDWLLTHSVLIRFFSSLRGLCCLSWGGLHTEPFSTIPLLLLFLSINKHYLTIDCRVPELRMEIKEAFDFTVKF